MAFIVARPSSRDPHVVRLLQGVVERSGSFKVRESYIKFEPFRGTIGRLVAFAAFRERGSRTSLRETTARFRGVGSTASDPLDGVSDSRLKKAAFVPRAAPHR